MLVKKITFSIILISVFFANIFLLNDSYSYSIPIYVTNNLLVFSENYRVKFKLNDPRGTYLTEVSPYDDKYFRTDGTIQTLNPGDTGNFLSKSIINLVSSKINKNNVVFWNLKAKYLLEKAGTSSIYIKKIYKIDREEVGKFEHGIKFEPQDIIFDNNGNYFLTDTLGRIPIIGILYPNKIPVYAYKRYFETPNYIVIYKPAMDYSLVIENPSGENIYIDQQYNILRITGDTNYSKKQLTSYIKISFLNNFEELKEFIKGNVTI